jgi:HK97 family phage major capsid protein
MQTKSERLRSEAEAAAKTARLIADRADSEGRGLTATEQADFDAKFAEAVSKKEQAAAAKRDDDILAQAKALAGVVGPVDLASDVYGGISHGMRKSASPWAKTVADRLETSMRLVDGQKAITSGSYGVPNVISPDITTPGEVPTAILDLIEVLPAASDGSGGNSFTFLRQTVRTNNAAVVADNATKPTSVYTITEIEDRFRVIAHLSEAIPIRYFADHAQLEDWLRGEMEYGLQRALETEVLSGDGTGEHLTGILNTSGIVTQAFATDIFTTTRKALSQLQNTGQQPTAFVFSVADSEAIDLAQDTQARFYGSGPFAAGPQTLWNLPRVTSTSLASGTAILADWKQATLAQREGATLAVDTAGDLFDKNQVKMRVEGRFGLAISRPGAFAKITTAAA